MYNLYICKTQKQICWVCFEYWSCLYCMFTKFWSKGGGRFAKGVDFSIRVTQARLYSIMYCTQRRGAGHSCSLYLWRKSRLFCSQTNYSTVIITRVEVSWIYYVMRHHVSFQLFCTTMLKFFIVSTLYWSDPLFIMFLSILLQNFLTKCA